MRFLGNMLGSFAILLIMMFILTALLPASWEAANETVVFDFGLPAWQRLALIPMLLALTVWIAFKTPPFGINVWHIRIFMLFLIVTIPLMVVQIFAAWSAGGELASSPITLMGLWLFFLAGIIYRSKLRPALWLKPREVSGQTQA